MNHKPFSETERQLIEEYNCFNNYFYARKNYAYLKRAESIASHTKEQWLLLCEKYDFKCCRCGTDVIGGIPTKDHIIPVYLGGSSAITNIQPLCRECNISKGRKTISYL